jgi:undecaprenyl diphosphate synthase
MNFFDKLNEKIKINTNNLPVHIAIIMDGNRRWAKKKNLPIDLGHRQGANTLKNILEYCSSIGIKYLTVYAFSTENWKRPKEQVDDLMSLLSEYLENVENQIKGKNIIVKVLGDINELSHDLRQKIKNIENVTCNNSGLTFNIALNYGGKNEIINAVKHIVKDVKSNIITEDDINEKMFDNYLYTANQPHPDLLIRTAGEMRISNFLLYQIAYSEFWFTKKFWPDFKKGDLDEAIIEYQKRNRRYGGI